jgi:hypothetical protein
VLVNKEPVYISFHLFIATMENYEVEPLSQEQWWDG